VDVDISLDYGLTLLAALLIGTGFVLQQNAAEREPASRFLSLRLMTDLLRAPRWLAGITAMICGQVLAAWSIGHLTLSVVEPLLTTNLIWALILAVPLSMRAQAKRAQARREQGSGARELLPQASGAAPLAHAPAGPVAPVQLAGPQPGGAGPEPAGQPPGRPRRAVRAWEVGGAVVLCVGVGLLSASRSTKPIGLSFGSFSHWPAAAIIAAIAVACVQGGRRRKGRARALLTGVAAGLVYGIQDALTRQALEALNSGGVSALLSTWAPYALVGAGAIGIWLMQSAFSAGPLQMSLPAISAGEPLVGILLGIVVFGDRIQVIPLQLAMKAGGIAALVAGVILVARAPALSQLRTWPPAGGLSLPAIPHPAIPHPTIPHPGLPHRDLPHPGVPGAGRRPRDTPAGGAPQAPPDDGRPPPADNPPDHRKRLTG
jgi:hypothetical protein